MLTSIPARVIGSLFAMKIGIVGLGLIGGSIGLALREPGREIVGHDPSPANAELAKSRFCVDSLAPLADVAKADVVFVAAPPLHVLGVLEQISRERGPSTVVTDCTSVKAEIVAWAEAAKANWFVGGHPMAGHEKSGPGFASSWMFRNARWILTPASKTDRSAIQAVEALVKSMGATPVKTDANGHDRQVAILSHIPHVFAAVLVNLGAGLSRTDISGGSWRDLTRVGGVDPDLWSQILIGNRMELVKALTETEEEVHRFRVALEDEDSATLHEILVQAQRAKKAQES